MPDQLRKSTLSGISAMQAYHADMAGGKASIDGNLVMAATLVRQAVLAAEDPKTQARILEAAVATAKTALGRDVLARGCIWDTVPAESPIEVIRVLAEYIEGKNGLAL